MVLTMFVTHTDDGFTAEVSSLKGCDSWAHKEEDAINGVLELVRFYLNLNEDVMIRVDKASKKKNVSTYKLLLAKEL